MSEKGKRVLSLVPQELRNVDSEPLEDEATKKSRFQREKAERIIAISQAQKMLEEAKRLLKVLPQGHNSTLDADLVDGLHAAEIIAQAVAQAAKKVSQKFRVTGGGARGISSIAQIDTKDHHLLDGLEDVADHTYAFLHNGTRAMTGNLDMGDNDLVDAKLLLPKESQTSGYHLGSNTKRWYELYCRRWLKWNYAEAAGNATISTGQDDFLSFVSALAAGNQTVARVTSGYINIFRAGDITMLANKTLTTGVGTKHDGLIVKPAAEVQTTDAVQTTVDSITLLDENTYHVEAEVVGVKSDGTDRATYHLACTVYRTGAGGATLQGAVTSFHTQESDANWDATFTVNGNDLRVSVTGVAATTVEWGCTMLYMNMSN